MNPETELPELPDPLPETGKSKDVRRCVACPITGHNYQGTKYGTSGGLKEKHINRRYNHN